MVFGSDACYFGRIWVGDFTAVVTGLLMDLDKHLYNSMSCIAPDPDVAACNV
jgi:hypothetical protein